MKQHVKNVSYPPVSDIHRPVHVAEKEPGIHQSTVKSTLMDEVLTASGQPLDSTSRHFFEPYFGHNFSKVRIHSDAEAGESAKEMSALAYTLKDHIVFAPGQYTPSTSRGRSLLAHELAHVVQQRDAAASNQAGMIHRQAESAQAAGREESLGDESLGDEIRKEIRKAAEYWEKEKLQIISNKDLMIARQGRAKVYRFGPLSIEYGREGGQKNYTTCIQFAQRMFAEALAKTNSIDPQKTLEMAGLLRNLQGMINKELELQFTLDDLEKRLSLQLEPESEAQGKINTLDKEIQELKLKAQEDQAKLDQEMAAFRQQQEKIRQEGASQAQPDYKPQRELRRELMKTQNALRQAALRHAQIMRIANQIGKQKTSIENKIKDTSEKLSEQQLANAAWVKPDNEGVFGNRPEDGDYILLGQPMTGPYGVSASTQVTLRAGAFRHINVLQYRQTLEEEDLELWHTIDGGGTQAVQRDYYVRLSDHLVFRDKKPEVYPDNPWKNTQPSYMLLGWIDIETLVNQFQAAQQVQPAQDKQEI